MEDYFGKDTGSIKNKKLFLFDLDGTIYLGNKLFPGMIELFNTIKDMGAKFVFVSNNPSRSIADYIKKLTSMGIDCDESNFFTSVQASVILLKEKYPNKLVYIQGTKSFEEELIRQGIKVTTKYNSKADLILVALDTEINDEKRTTTCRMLKDFDIPYIATNPDIFLPTEDGYVPDCGTMCNEYKEVTGKYPIFIGKPEPTIINLVIQKFGYNKEDVILIGDRIYTDIKSGYNANIDTVLVLCGESTIETYNNSDIKPTYVLKHTNLLLK